jgi:hypothetical protein
MLIVIVPAQCGIVCIPLAFGVLELLRVLDSLLNLLACPLLRSRTVWWRTQIIQYLRN